MSAGKKLFDAALEAEGVSGSLADLARSIYVQESSGGKNTGTSSAGARGGMQIIPATFNRMADKGWSIDDPLQNARAGIRYLRHLDKLSGGVPELTAAGYYGGEGGLAKAKRGIAVADPREPKAPNTLEYGQQVVARMGKGTGEKPGALVASAPDATERPVMEVPLQVGVAAPAPPPTQVAQVAQMPAQLGPDPWEQFLGQLPQNRAPVDVASLSFGNPIRPVDMGRNPRPQPQAVVPNFEAFSGWRGRAA